MNHVPKNQDMLAPALKGNSDLKKVFATLLE